MGYQQVLEGEISALKEKIAASDARLAAIAREWLNAARDLRAEADRIRRTVKAPTDAEDFCLRRAEVYGECARAIFKSNTTMDGVIDDAARFRMLADGGEKYWPDDEVGLHEWFYNAWSEGGDALRRALDEHKAKVDAR